MSAIVVTLAAFFALLVLRSFLAGDERVEMPAEGRATSASADSQTVESLVLAGRKIDAIKQLRAETGLGLKEAKDEVDAMCRRVVPS